MVQKRSVGMNIVLTLVTLGIYGFYWMTTLNTDVAQECGEPPIISNGMLVLLTIVTCGIYMVYWAYKQGERLERVRAAKGKPAGSLPVLYLVLALVFFIVGLALMQNEVNENIA